MWRGAPIAWGPAAPATDKPWGSGQAQALLALVFYVSTTGLGWVMSREASQPRWLKISPGSQREPFLLVCLPLPLTALPLESDFTSPLFNCPEGHTGSWAPGGTGVLEDRSLPSLLGNSRVGISDQAGT